MVRVLVKFKIKNRCINIGTLVVAQFAMKYKGHERICICTDSRVTRRALQSMAMKSKLILKYLQPSQGMNCGVTRSLNTVE